jgi:predicted HicB family RNase H-like nuclease
MFFLMYTASVMKRGRPKKVASNTFYVRLPQELALRLRNEAEREKRDLTATIERILEQHYAQLDSVSAS